MLLADAPMGYTPPRGPSVNLQLRYNHREENQPQWPAPSNPLRVEWGPWVSGSRRDWEKKPGAAAAVHQFRDVDGHTHGFEIYE